MRHHPSSILVLCPCQQQHKRPASVYCPLASHISNCAARSDAHPTIIIAPPIFFSHKPYAPCPPAGHGRHSVPRGRTAHSASKRKGTQAGICVCSPPSSPTTSFSAHPYLNPFPLQVTALLLTGQRPDAPPCLGPGASESSSEATYLALLCDQEEEKKRRKGRNGSSDGRAPTTTHTVPPSHIAGLLRQEMARQQEMVRLHSSSSMCLLPLVLSINSTQAPPSLPLSVPFP